MQLLIGAGLAGVALTIPTHFFFQATLAVFWLIAFSSATHDIAADGFYMLGLDSHEQAFFVGIRSTFYRIAMISGQGLLVMLAGFLETHTGNIPLAWSISFFVLSGLFIALFLYHKYILPHPVDDKPSSTVTPSTILKEFLATFVSFFKKKQALVAILFMLLFRFPEAQLVKLVTPFLVDPKSAGGLGLTTAEIGFVYGTIGTIGLVVGGILGGIAASRGGLKKWLWPMTLAITLPDAVYIYLSSALPDSMFIINLCVFIEQFGYGFGFSAYMLYLMYYSAGEHKTSHYAICTAFMALGMMLPGMAAGWLEDHMGYANFFWWVMGCCIVTLIVTAFLKIDPEYGKKQ
jgi:PAT family beta-lactamase induction signal transducer AmpG